MRDEQGGESSVISIFHFGQVEGIVSLFTEMAATE